MTAALAAIAMAGGASAATIVGNGDFETVDGRLGVLTGDSDGDALNSLAGKSGARSWDVYATLPGGWFSGMGAGIEVQTRNTISGADPHSGEHYIELDSEAARRIGSNSDARQNLGALSGRYELSFWYRPRTGKGATDGILVELLGGATLSQAVVGTDTTRWVNFVLPFVASGAADVTLRFAATGRADEHGGFIDTVSVAPVPLPASALLLAGGLAGFAALRRRRAA